MALPNDESIQESKTTDQFRDPQVDRLDAPVANAALKAVEAGNAKDVDIAAQILADYGADEDQSWTKEEEKKLIRKVDWLIVPIVSSCVFLFTCVRVALTCLLQLFVCATLSGLDKTAISAAAIYGIKDDLNLSGSEYSWIGSAPFFGGLLFMGPSAYLMQR